MRKSERIASSLVSHLQFGHDGVEGSALCEVLASVTEQYTNYKLWDKITWKKINQAFLLHFLKLALL